MKIILLMAVTADGKIARSADHFPDWTGPQDKRLFVQISKKAGVVIMGSSTYKTIGSPLPGRLNIVMTRKNMASDSPGLLFTGNSPAKILQMLKKKGFNEAVLAGGTTINSLFAEAGLIDEIILTVSPLVFGTGLNLFSSPLEMRLRLKKFHEMPGNLLYVHYDVLK